MNKTNKQFLAYAVALAASFSTVPGISHAAAAAEPSAAAAPVMQADAAVQNVPSAAEEKTEAPKEQQAGEAAQTSAKAESENTQADERAKEWNKNRPQDKAIEDMMKQYEGLTIVDTVFEGTTKLTETTAKAALSMRTGDMFTAKGLNKDRDAIYNIGYFMICIRALRRCRKASSSPIMYSRIRC